MAAQDSLAQRELSSRRRHGLAKLGRSRAIAALEQAVEVRNVAEPGCEGDLRNRPATTRAIEQISPAEENTLLVDVFADRTACSCEHPCSAASGEVPAGNSDSRLLR